MDEALIDTDILSEVLKARDRKVLGRVRLYLKQHRRFGFSAITFYEMLRGFRATQAVRQLSSVCRARREQRRGAGVARRAGQSGQPLG